MSENKYLLVKFPDGWIAKKQLEAAIRYSVDLLGGEILTDKILPIAAMKKVWKNDATEEYKKIIKQQIARELGNYLLEKGHIAFSENTENKIHITIGLFHIVDGRADNEQREAD